MWFSVVLVLRLLRVAHTHRQRHTYVGVVGNLCDALLDRVYAVYPLNVVGVLSCTCTVCAYATYMCCDICTHIL